MFSVITRPPEVIDPATHLLVGQMQNVLLEIELVLVNASQTTQGTLMLVVDPIVL